jgi:transposase
MERSGRAPILPARDAGRGYEGAPLCPTDQLRHDGYRHRQELIPRHRLDRRGANVLRRKWSRSQVEIRFANMPPRLVGMELQSHGHDARLMPAKYGRPYAKGQNTDFNDAETIAEAVQRPTMKFVATKTAEQLDLQALHRVRERLVGPRTGVINQIRAFLLERGVAVR